MKKIILDRKIVIGLSDRTDGNMRTIGRIGDDLEKVEQNRAKFLASIDLAKKDATLLMIDYDRANFCQYAVANDNFRGVGVIYRNSVKSYDGIATKEKNLGLFLPLADCLGAVIFDPVHEVLMVSHLGRHSTEQFGAEKSIKFLREQFNSDPAKVKIWLSPAAGKINYPLYKFNGRSLYEVNAEQFAESGILRENISGGEIDTTVDLNYFSHSAGDKTSRFAIAAKII